MSHYQPYKGNTQPKKFPVEGIGNFLGKKRTEKRYEYDEKYYEKYAQNKYHVPYQKGYHPTKYHNEYYSNNKQYHNPTYTPKSPRRDYKKAFQKYPGDNEGVRNLSHCELPSPKLQKEMSFNLLRNFPNQQNNFQQPPFQHIVQNQQNISISIISPNQLNINSGRHYSSGSPIKNNPQKNDFNAEQNKFQSAIPKPIPKLPRTVFDKKSVKLEETPFSENLGLPSFEDTNITLSNNLTDNLQLQKTVELQPSFLLNQISNKILLSKMMGDSFNSLNEQRFENIPLNIQKQNKSSLIYNEKYAHIVEEYTKRNKLNKENLMNQIKNTKKLMDHNEYEVRKLKFKIYENNWKFDQLNAKDKAIDESINK